MKKRQSKTGGLSPSKEGNNRTPKQKQKRRKLRDSENNGDQQQSQTERDAPTSKFTHDEIVHHISAFLSGKAPTSSSVTANVSDSEMDIESNEPISAGGRQTQRKEPLDSISYLVQFLEVDCGGSTGTLENAIAEDIASDVIITKGDVATLLLPWSVARLMRLAAASSDDAMSGADEVAWRALAHCLDILSPKESEAETTVVEEMASEAPSNPTSYEALLSASLSQSTLNRLVPYAAKTSFASTPGKVTTNSSSDGFQTHASNCFLHLARRFRPSLDSACNTLLCEIDDLVSSSMDKDAADDKSMVHQHQHQVTFLPAHQANVVDATLNVILFLMPSANPKRLFGTICSVDVLPRLGRLKLVCTESSKTDDANTEEGSSNSAGQLVQDILWGGLFHPMHHMDGFRTMRELQTMASLPKLSAGEKEEGDVDQAKAEDVVKETKKGKSNQKSCFQSSLFTTLQKLLSLPAITDDKDSEDQSKKAIQNATATANLLPLITNGFFQQVRDHAQRTASSGSTSEADAKLQFRFWCHAMLPALETLFLLPNSSNEEEFSELGITLVNATSMTLGYIVEYDAYLPSYSDPEEQHLAFLTCVTKGLLQCIDGNSSDLSDQKIQALVTSFRQILLMNHRLLHEKLSDVISFACSCLPISHQSDQSQKSAQAKALLSSIVKIYRELRQVGYFLSSARGAFGAPHSSQTSGLEFMNNLLNCTDVMESLALAYQSCPSGQLIEIWEFFDGWIVDIIGQNKFAEQPESSELVGTTSAAATELSFAVQMFILFIKNVRSNKQNSPELRSLCEKSVETSISKLLGKTHGGSSNISADSEGNHGFLMRQGFDLCGWLVDLHTRSCFWIDSIDVDGHGSSFLLTQNSDEEDELNVLAYLRNVAETTVSTEQYKTWKTTWLQNYWKSAGESNPLAKCDDIGVPLLLRGSLQRLALHRVHQLHSMIYYCNLQESERHASDLKDDHTSSQALTNEARMLVEFSLYIACSQITVQSNAVDAAQGSSESLWSPVAQSLSIWTHYSDPFQVELFLIWFFTALCQNNILAKSAQAHLLEKTIALTLARDASFYYVSKVMSLFVKVGLRFAFGQFLSSIDTNDKLPEKIFEESKGLVVSCMELTMKGNAKLSLQDNDSIDTVSTALSFLASASLELTLRNENLSLLDRVVGLDILASQVIKEAHGVENCKKTQLLNIVGSARSIIANILPKTLLFSSDFDAPCLAKLTSHLSKTCLDFGFDCGVLYSSADAIGEYFSMCIDYYEKNPSMLEKFFSQMGTLVRGAADIFNSDALLIRSVIQRMNILLRHNSLSKTTNASSSTSSSELCMKFVQSVEKSLGNIMIQHMTDAGNDQKSSNVVATALLLESEILSFFGHHLVMKPVTDLMTNEQIEASKESVQKVFQLAKCAQGSKQCLNLTEAWGYFLSSMAAAPCYLLECVPSSSVLESTLEAMALSYEHGQESPLLDAALCSIIRNSDLEQTKFITTHVLNCSDDCKSNDPAFVVKIFHLLMTCANSPEQHKHISDRCKVFLLISMDLLRDKRPARSRYVSNVELFSKSMTTLISKKELLLLSGREIAMICCEMSPLFHGGENNDFDGNDAIFKSCCSVVASLVAHYPKQLYGCPSPLFSLLLALLSHILQSSVKTGLSQKTLEYAKICELLVPHKEIFKKHVVGLILCYVQALNKGMNPNTKSKLMPSIYALLDMCSDYETRQINAMIDVSSKALFAPVFQSYRKFYQYHGQA